MMTAHRPLSKARLSRAVGTLMGAATLLLAASVTVSEAQDSVTLRVSTSAAADDPRQVCGLEPLRDAVKKAGIDLQIFPAGQLGNGNEQLEAMQNGTIDMIPQDGARLAQFVPEFDIMGAAYLFRDTQDVYDLTHGPVGKELEDKLLEATGIRVLAYWPAGARQVTSMMPIHGHDDLEGVKLRVNPTLLAETTVKGMGAVPIALSIGQLYTALQNGTVDAQENPINTIAVRHFDEVQEYVNLTDHSQFTLILTISDSAWSKLSETQRETLMKEALATEEPVARCSADSDEAQLAEWESSDNGLKVNRDVDKASFEQPVYEAYIEAYGNESPLMVLYDRIKASLQ